MFITYSNSSEVIVTTKDHEKATLILYFDQGGRDVEEYDREEHNEDAIDISAIGFSIR